MSQLCRVASLGVLLVSLPIALAFAEETEAVEGAEMPEVFGEYKCSMCHSVAGAGVVATTKLEKMKGPDLGGYTTEDRGALFEFLTRAVEVDGDKHNKEFKGTREELDEILDWLAEQEPENSGSEDPASEDPAPGNPESGD